MRETTIQEVQKFWEEYPLFKGESAFAPGTLEYFEEHRKVYIEDCFAGSLDERLYPESQDGLTLDLGCGPAFWAVEFLASGNASNLIATDLTYHALQIARKRFDAYHVHAGLTQANAEILPFKSETFDHVNCLGVIHHTPKTEQCVAEISRVLKSGGKAVICVYYRNLLLRNWKYLSGIGKVLARLGAKMPGRGRKEIFLQDDANELVRLYDGAENPLGKAYSKQDVVNMLTPYFRIEQIFYHFFPARSLPIRISHILHNWLDKHLPFMIYVKVMKA